ncbi:MAG: DUF4442 domain-containing protein [Chitinophagaceae bacterium]
MNPNFHSFQKKITNPIKYRAFLLAKLPLGFITGLTITSLTEEQAAVSVKFGWINQNPFKSIYFAVLSMAAELSTGVLALGQVAGRKPAVSMLVTKCEGQFLKKATGKIVFTCKDGNAIAKTVEGALATGNGVEIKAATEGINEKGETVAIFHFTWSFKAKSA